MRSLPLLLSCAIAGTILGVASTGSAQPQPGYGPTPGYGQPQPQYGQPQRQPYGQPYGPQQGYSQAPQPVCCNWSFRFNAADLIFERATLEIEYAPPFVNFLSFELNPGYMFGAGLPGSGSDDYSGKGWLLGGKVGFWFENTALKGWNLKALLKYSRYSYESDYGSTAKFGETTLGVMAGSQTVFGTDSGFTLSWGLGLGYIVNAKGHLIETGANPPGSAQQKCSDDPTVSSNQVKCIKHVPLELLGQLAVGYTF